MADTRSPVAVTGPPVTDTGPPVVVTRAPVTDGYREAMGLALAEAHLARAAGDVPVGAVVVAADGAAIKNNSRFYT